MLWGDSVILPGVIASSGGVASSYESIATTTVGSGGSSSVSFSSIPSTFKHLQVRVMAQTNRATYGTDGVYMTFNGDTTSGSYSWHGLKGDGANASAASLTSQNNILWNNAIATSAASVYTFGAMIIDLLDYVNTNKYKTARSFTGHDLNGTVSGFGGAVYLQSGLWFKAGSGVTSDAISSITFTPQVGTIFTQFSSFALYGVKA